MNREPSAMMHQVEELVSRAMDVQVNAYAPYTKFMVGAAVLTKTGNIYIGCNVQGVDNDDTHAEEAALCAMVAAGERHPILVVAVGALEGCAPTIIPPCGKCRQKLMEWSSLNKYDIEIMLATGIVQLSDLLPHSFGPADIGIDLAEHST
ncbi:MAG: cytidine deaminase [Patescibacteria group bacterium]